MPAVDWSSSDCTTTTVWYTWTCDATTTTNAAVWTDWTTSGTCATITGNSYEPITFEPPTPEQIAEQQRQAAEWRRQADERARERAEAAQRAEQLLRDNLSPAQLAEYEQHGHFHVRGESARNETFYMLQNEALDLLPDTPTHFGILHPMTGG